MGSVDGGLSEAYNITGISKTISIPLPTPNPDLIDSVILYNMSPYLIEVDMGVSNKGWLGPFMVDKFAIGSRVDVKCTPTAIAGQNPAFPIPVAILSAAFIMTSETADNAGTYPIALLSSQAVLVASVLDLVYPDGNTAIYAQDYHMDWYTDGGGPDPVIQIDPFGGVQIAGSTGIVPGRTNGSGIGIAPLQEVIGFQPVLADPNAVGGSIQASAAASGHISNLLISSGISTFAGFSATLELSSDNAGNAIPHAIIYPPLQTTDPGTGINGFNGTLETWKPLIFKPGWSNAFGVCSVRLNAVGAVEFKGTAIKSSAGVKGETIATLPGPAYYPGRTVQLAASGDGNATPPNIMLQILNSGNINFYEGSSTASVAGLDGLSYYIQ